MPICILLAWEGIYNKLSIKLENSVIIVLKIKKNVKMFPEYNLYHIVLDVVYMS